MDLSINRLRGKPETVKSTHVYLLLFRSAARYWRRHLWQAVLMLLGIALGIAVVFSVDIANQSAKRAFALSLDSITGRATHHVFGGNDGIDETVYTYLRTELGFRASAPLIEGAMTAGTDSHTETLQLLGIDIFAESMFRNQLDSLQDNSSQSVSGREQLALLQTGSVILGHSTAARLGLEPGDTLAAEVDGTIQNLRLINLVDTEQQPSFDTLAMVDISTAQQLLGSFGRLSRIDLIVQDDAQLRQLQTQLGEKTQGLRVVEAARRNNALQQMTAAFHTNLLAMSLLALLVGAFLIYNSVTLSVLQRRTLFGQLRVLGMQKTELALSVVLEALAFAVVGGALGLLLGYLLGGLLLHLVTRTINDLYFVLDVRRLDFPLASLLKAIALGLAATLIAVLAPAREAALSPPVTLLQRSHIESGTRRVVPLLFVCGLLACGAGALILFLSATLFMAFVALFFIVVGYSLMIPRGLVWLMALLSFAPGFSRNGIGQYPLRSMTASLSRTSVAVAALVVAVSATCGVGVMIDSFRLSVEDWLAQTLKADIYIRDGQSLRNALPPELVASVKELDGVVGLRLARMLEIEVQGLPADLLALDFYGSINKGLSFAQQFNRDKPASELWQQWQRPQSVFISEPLAWRHQLGEGDQISIATRSGDVLFTIAGVFTDYGAGKGTVIASLPTTHQHFSDRGLSSIGVVLEPEAPDTVRQLRELLARNPGLIMRSNRDIRQLSRDIFDQTFAITHVLRLLTVGVAFIGILSALLALSLERRAEFAVLRALGMTPSELRRLLFVQTGLMGTIAGLLALPLGLVMSAVLIAVINVRSFGWTMQFHVSGQVLLESVLLALVAALLAGWYPARQLSRLSPAEALRHQ